MDSLTPIPLLSFAPVIAVVAVAAAGVAAMTGRRLVAIVFGLVAIAAVPAPCCGRSCREAASGGR